MGATEELQKMNGSRHPLSRALDVNGDGTGTKSAVGNYVAGEDFYIQPPAGEVYYITRLLIHVHDGNGFSAEKYGALVALTNGISVIHEVNGVENDLNDGIPVMSNAGWSGLCYDAQLLTWGAGEEVLAVRFTFEKLGTALKLDGNNNDKLIVRIGIEDLTGLIDHYFLAQGNKEGNI